MEAFASRDPRFQPSPPYAQVVDPSPSVTASSEQSALTKRRMQLIATTEGIGRDRSVDFDVRVRCARAAAIGKVLFGDYKHRRSDTLGPSWSYSSSSTYSPPAAVDSLKLPTAQDIGPLLDIYRANVEWICNVIIVDLNRSRIENFLTWWHSNPQTLPADPPLVPLVLTILALAIQARRTVKRAGGGHFNGSTTAKGRDKAKGNRSKIKHEATMASENSMAGGAPSSRAQSPVHEWLDSCSSERELLETAGRCVDALQIACPSNWSSAFSAPLDLVRANLLRGLWHLNELHLQFAGSCFAATMRLAHAAALHRDARHWPHMGKEEAQARRNMFWNVVLFETINSMRLVQPPSVMADGFDTEFPDDHDALLGLYRRAGLIEPYILEGRRSNLRVQPPSKASFDFHLVRFKLARVLIPSSARVSNASFSQSDMAEAFETWKRELPPSLAGVLDSAELGKLGVGTQSKERRRRKGDGDEAREREDDRLESDERETRYLQDAFLQMLSLATSIQVHRPQADETGSWRPPEGQAQRSLEVCIDSAQRLIWLIWGVVTREPGPPYVLYNFCIFYCFQAAIIIAIQSALCSPNNNDAPSNSSALKNKGKRTNVRGAEQQAAFGVLARPSLDRAVRALDLISTKLGLRNVAEQAARYAATLREIDARAREESNDVGSVLTNANVQAPAVGAPPQIMVEGDGRTLGGQGYPSRHPSTSPEPAGAPATGLTANQQAVSEPLNNNGDSSSMSNPGNNAASIFDDFDFDVRNYWTEVFGEQRIQGVFADRPFIQADVGHFPPPAPFTVPSNSSPPSAYEQSHGPVQLQNQRQVGSSASATGLDLLAAQVDFARPSPHGISYGPSNQQAATPSPATTRPASTWTYGYGQHHPQAPSVLQPHPSTASSGAGPLPSLTAPASHHYQQQHPQALQAYQQAPPTMRDDGRPGVFQPYFIDDQQQQQQQAPQPYSSLNAARIPVRNGSDQSEGATGAVYTSHHPSSSGTAGTATTGAAAQQGLGESFASNWNEWERMAERLLQN